MNISNIKKILIIRLSSIGDIVLTTGFVRILRELFPLAQIDYLLYNQFKPILEFNPRINKLICIDKKNSKIEIENLIKNIELQTDRYDLVIDLQGNSKSIKIVEALGCKSVRIDKRRLYKLGLVWAKIGKNRDYKVIHQIYLETLAEFGATDDNSGLEYWLESDVEINEYQPHKRTYEPKDKLNILIAPGAHFKTKRWSAQNYSSLVELLIPYSESIKIIGGANDFVIGQSIILNNKTIENMCGKLSLSETADLIGKSDLLITNDTGVMHIAAARQTPVTAIFGSTVKELGFVPFRVKNIIIESNQFCRPCTHIGRNFCPLMHHKCMEEISPEFAFQKIIKLVMDIYNFIQ